MKIALSTYLIRIEELFRWLGFEQCERCRLWTNRFIRCDQCSGEPYCRECWTPHRSWPTEGPDKYET
jgi:hypothetical protein